MFSTNYAVIFFNILNKKTILFQTHSQTCLM